MGNSQPRYCSDKESREALGAATHDRLLGQLRALCEFGHYVDFSSFRAVLAAHFESMPPKLYENLFSAFANDLQSKIEINDFISGLAVLFSTDQDKTQQRRFLFRVYDVADAGEMDKLYVERVLLMAYGETLNKAAAIAELKEMFSYSVHHRYMNLKEFETYTGPTETISGWIRAVLTVFVEPASTKLSSLERRYSAALEVEQMMDRFSVDRETCERLRRLFYRKCEETRDPNVDHGFDTKAELSEAAWVEWTSGFIVPDLSRILFRSKLTGLKHVWRFQDFAEFCMILGTSHSIETKAAFLCVLFQQYALNCEQKVVGENDFQKSPSSDEPDSDAKSEIITDTKYISDNQLDVESDFIESRQLMKMMRYLIELLSLPAEYISTSLRSTTSNGTLLPLNETIEAHLAELEATFQEIDSNSNSLRPGCGATLQAYVSFICDNVELLPGIQLLSMTACCLFGLRPPTPQLEKIYITELMLWGQELTTQDAEQPHGPEGAEWALIVSTWWDLWRYFVGRSSSHNHQPSFPGEINNYTLLKSDSSVAQLQPGFMLKRDCEAIPVNVFAALQSWHGGGPPIYRKVVSGLINASGIPREHSGRISNETRVHKRPLLELFPLCIRIYTCDNHGHPSQAYPRELLCSQVSSVGSILSKLNVDARKARLWNFDPKNNNRNSWKGQRVLTPEISLQDIGMQNEDALLLELSLPDGTWPKSMLHSDLESEEARRIGGSDPISPLSPLNETGTLILNDGGKVGLDNLGNTCYMNSSLQALLHTPHLVEYFLRKTHLRELNVDSKFGFKGRLAMAFGKLCADLWLYRPDKDNHQTKDKSSLMAAASNAMSTLKNMGNAFSSSGRGLSISPRKFRREIMALHEQFDNNDQHDAHELLTFLLDGLSEDLNLVHDKPYVEQPDSDDREDCELAQIWWDNHLKRDNSVMQSLFTGQFKSVTKCTEGECSYHSARFEPFNILSLPLPDNEQRVMIVHVVARQEKLPVKCAVLVPKSRGRVSDIDTALRLYKDIPGLQESDFHFIVFKLHRGKIVHLFESDARVDSIRETDEIFFYQVRLDKDVQAIGQLSSSCITDGSRSKSPPSVMPSKRPLNTTLVHSPSTNRISKRADTRKEAAIDRDFEIAGPSLPTAEDIHDSLKVEHEMIDMESSGSEMDVANEENQEEHEHIRTVIFVQRRLKSSKQHMHKGGLKAFKMEAVGLPLAERLPGRIHPRVLYEIVEQRVRQFFKTSILELQRRNNSGISDPSFERHSSVSMTVRPIATEDAVGGDIPSFGFVLRFVKTNGECCSRCHWLNRCEGCLIPCVPDDDCNDDVALIDLRELESIAIDWHYIVFQEALDVFPVDFSRLPTVSHKSLATHKKQQSLALPLSKCLQKFTEEEALDDMVCPLCKSSDGCLRRSFALWRLPPVLVIQLKRFQFNAYSRRKLTNHVKFPFDGLDLSCYLAPTHELFANFKSQQRNEKDSVKDLTAEDAHSDHEVVHTIENGEMQNEDKEGMSVYDLYSVVHHIGALGGGHYVASVKDDFSHLNEILRQPHQQGSKFNETPESDCAKKWFCYDDSVVSATTPDDISAGSSAYLLFYLRRDVNRSSVFSLHSHGGISDQDTVAQSVLNEGDLSSGIETSEGSKLKDQHAAKSSHRSNASSSGGVPNGRSTRHADTNHHGGVGNDDTQCRVS